MNPLDLSGDSHYTASHFVKATVGTLSHGSISLGCSTELDYHHYHYYHQYHCYYYCYNYKKVILITSMINSSSHSVCFFFMWENIHLWDGYVSKNLGHRAESRLILRFAIFFSKNFRCSGIFHTSKLSVLKSGETGPLARRWFEREQWIFGSKVSPLCNMARQKSWFSKRKDMFSNDMSYIYIYIHFLLGGMESRSYWNGIYRMKKFGEIKIFARIRWQVVPSAWFHHSSLKNCPSVFFCESEKMMIADCPTNQIWFFSAGLSTKHLGRKYLTSKPWCMELSIPPVPRHVWKLHTETVDLLERCVRKLELFRSVPVVPALMKGLMFGVLVLTTCYHFQASESQWHQGIAGIPKNHQMPTCVSYSHLACYTQEATWHLP